MNIKQLLLISVLCTFSAQATEELKVAQEQEGGKEVVVRKKCKEFELLQKNFPNTIKFLYLALGKNDIKKRGLPNDIICKIINEFLLVDGTQYLYYNKDLNKHLWTNEQELQEYNVSHRDILRWAKKKKYWPLPTLALAPHPFFRVPDYQDTIFVNSYRSLIAPEVVQEEIIDNSNQHVLQNKIALWIKNHKVPSLVAVSAAVGTLAYMANKLRK